MAHLWNSEEQQDQPANVQSAEEETDLQPPVRLLRGKHDRDGVVEDQAEHARSRGGDAGGLGSESGSGGLGNIAPSCSGRSDRLARGACFLMEYIQHT